MTTSPRRGIADSIKDNLRCPLCKDALLFAAAGYSCQNKACGRFYAVIQGTPVFLDKSFSVFPEAQSRPAAPGTGSTAYARLRSIVAPLVPTISRNHSGAKNYRELSSLLFRENPEPVVLIIGGAALGSGIEELLSKPGLRTVETDVILGGRASLICDAHALPFTDKTFDAVVAQAVLEHVLDPSICVKEFHRVLKDRGLVYAETPFIQQVHLKRYDFTRFTHLGHRRLFRMFEEISSGITGGPGMALAWSYKYFLLSFTASLWLRRALTLFAQCTSFWLTLIDRWLIGKPGAHDAASRLLFPWEESEPPDFRL